MLEKTIYGNKRCCHCNAHTAFAYYHVHGVQTTKQSTAHRTNFQLCGECYKQFRRLLGERIYDAGCYDDLVELIGELPSANFTMCA